MTSLPEWVDLPVRKSPRAGSHDYTTPGAYFLTFCTHNRVPMFGSLRNGRVELTGIGRMLDQSISQAALASVEISVDCSCVMPDHAHLIVWLLREPGAEVQDSIPRFMSRLKARAALRYSALRKDYPRLPENLFQRSYWDRYIRTEKELDAIRYYTLHNPLALQLKAEGVHIPHTRD